MVYAPRNEQELGTVLGLLRESVTFALTAGHLNLNTERT